MVYDDKRILIVKRAVRLKLSKSSSRSKVEV